MRLPLEIRNRLLLMRMFVVALALLPGNVACEGCPDEQRTEEPELPPLLPCMTTALPNCVFDPSLPTDPKRSDFQPGVGESREQRLTRWLSLSCESACGRLTSGIVESCSPATRRSDGVYRLTCQIKYDTCHDQGRI